MSAMRVLLLNLQWPPDVNSTGVLMEQVAQGLAQYGHHVTVLTSFPHYAGFRVERPWRGRLHQVERTDGLTVHRLWVYASGRKARMKDRLLSYLSFNALAAWVGATQRDSFDVIYATNGSFFTGLTARFIAGLRQRPYVFNVQDVYPDAPARAGKLVPGPVLSFLFALERMMYRRARKVTVIAPSFKNNLVAKGVPPERIEVVPNFVDPNFIRPLPKENDWSRAHGLDKSFVVAHAGNVGYNYDLETLLGAADLLRGDSAIQVVIVGEGVALEGLKRRAAGASNVRFLPFQPRADLPWMRAAFDVQVSLYHAGAGDHSMPSKIYEIMASGRPLIVSGDVEGDVVRQVSSAGCGLFVSPGDPEALATAIRQLHADPTLARRLGANGRKAVEEHFSKSTVVSRYADLLERAVSPVPR